MLRVYFVIVALVFSPLLLAKEVEITKVELEPTGSTWTVHVTLRHDDQGFEHYANGWRLVDAKKNVIAAQELYHPHDKKKSFTDSKANIKIPSQTKLVFLEAQAKPHGWSKQRVRIDLTKPKGDRYQIRSSKAR
jgi:hypothetical protein